METPRLDHPDFAEFYDELPLWSAPFAQRILERAPLRRGSVIFDVGCGTGFLALELAQRCGPDARVHAVDPWPAAMARLDRKLAYHGVGNVELVVRDAADTGLPDGSADLIVSNLGINNFDDPAAVLAECRRILKRGGRLMLTTNLRGHMAEVYAALREVAAELGLDAAGVDAAEAQRGTVSSTAGRLAAAGFVDVAHETTRYPMRFADGTAMLGHWFMRMAFIPGWVAAVGEANADRVLPALAARLDTLAAQAGDLALTIPVALFEARRGAD